MFKSVTIKLTLIYIAILLVIGAYFSINWYRVATNELNRALVRQSAMVELLPNVRGSDEFREILQEREYRLVEGKRNIAKQLVAVNIILVCIGGLGSYIMARRTLEPIEIAHKAQTRFTADASHELRTPLAAMQTEIEVALRDPKLGKAEAINLLKSNLEELAKLTALSEGLLQLARQDAHGEMTVDSINLNTVFTAVKQRTDKYAHSKGVAVSYDLADVFVRGQFEALVELLVNLVENAIKYSINQTPVAVRIKNMKQQVVVQVVDAGIGIATNELPHIFERFYRVDNSRTGIGSNGQAIQGHGLGLSIAQNIARVHGSEIKVQSKIGKGSTFSFTLPKSTKYSENM